MHLQQLCNLFLRLDPVMFKKYRTLLLQQNTKVKHVCVLDLSHLVPPDTFRIA